MEKPLIDFNTHSSILLVDEVQKICKPLFQYFDINLFYFERSYYKGSQQGRRLLLSSDKNFIKDYFSTEHYLYELANYPDQFVRKSFIVSIWDGCHSHHDSCKIGLLMQQKMNISHLFYLTWVYNENIENYCFGIKKEQDHIPQKLLFNIELFQHFCLHFNDIGQSIILEAEKDKFKVPPPATQEYSNPHYLGLDIKSKNQFLNKIPIEKIYLKDPFQDIYLTIDETKTIVLVCQNLQYDDVAKILSISLATVKYRMNNIREKCSVKNKNELIKIFLQSGLFDYCKLAVASWVEKTRLRL